MPAGDSAQEEARRLAAAAQRLRTKADNAENRAHRFDAGAGGERATAAVLASLTPLGWFVLHDRAVPSGGNLDHIAVGPAGAVVLDAKAWTYPVTVNNGRIFTGRWNRDRDLAHLIELRNQVQAALAASHPGVQSLGVLVCTEEPNSQRPVEVVEGCALVGVGNLLTMMKDGPHLLTPGQVEATMRTLSLAFPPAGAAQPPAPAVETVPTAVLVGEPRWERYNRTFLIKSWSRAGKSRLYLSNRKGDDLGYKDLSTGKVTISCHDEDEGCLAQAVLDGATASGVTLSHQDLPRIPLTVLGSKFVGRATRMHVSVLVGQEWAPKKRLYSTLIDPDVGRFDLGFVNLATGGLEPKFAGPVSKRHDTAVAYLGVVKEAWHNAQASRQR